MGLEDEGVNLNPMSTLFLTLSLSLTLSLTVFGSKGPIGQLVGLCWLYSARSSDLSFARLSRSSSRYDSRMANSFGVSVRRLVRFCLEMEALRMIRARVRVRGVGLRIRVRVRSLG